MKHSYYAGVSLFVLAALFAPSGFAQEPDTESQESETENNYALMDNIVVTTTLRSESLQDAPISVEVATREELERANVTSVLDLPRVAPGIVIERGVGTRTNVTVRGLGTNPASAVFESSVGFFVDGNYVPRTREFATSLFDVERVEVIRGTQGSLLGKNTTNGAVNLITRKPGDEYEVDLSVSREFELESWTVNGGVSIPLAETLSIRFSGLFDDQGGWVENTFTGGTPGGTSERVAGRVVLNWDPTANFEATARYEYQNNKLRGSDFEYIEQSPIALAFAGVSGFTGFESDFDRRTFTQHTQVPDGYSEDLDAHRAWLTLNWEIGEFLLTSQTAWSQSDNELASPFIFIPGDFQYSTLTSPSESFTQEVRLTSPAEDRFRYVVGAWYGMNDFNQDLFQFFDFPAALFGPLGGPASFVNFFDQHTETWSLFAQVDIDLTERLAVTGGVRYTNERKEADFAREPITPGFFSLVANPPTAPFTLSNTENNVDGVINFQYDLSDDLMVYVAWAQGTKGGGFSEAVTIFTDSPYEPEVARTTEIGLRYQTSDQQLTANLTGFYTDIKDFQLAEFTGAVFEISNTDVESIGVETELVWNPEMVPGLSFSWNNTFAETEDTGPVPATVPYSPRWSGSVAATYERDLSSGFTIVASGGVDYRSRTELNKTPDLVPPSDPYQLYNASIALESDKGYAIRVFGRNLSDNTYSKISAPAPFLTGSTIARANQPRTIGLNLSYRY